MLVFINNGFDSYPGSGCRDEVSRTFVLAHDRGGHQLARVSSLLQRCRASCLAVLVQHMDVLYLVLCKCWGCMDHSVSNVTCQPRRSCLLECKFKMQKIYKICGHSYQIFSSSKIKIRLGRYFEVFFSSISRQLFWVLEFKLVPFL
jgi:hypothetical protein